MRIRWPDTIFDDMPYDASVRNAGFAARHPGSFLGKKFGVERSCKCLLRQRETVARIRAELRAYIFLLVYNAIFLLFVVSIYMDSFDGFGPGNLATGRLGKTLRFRSCDPLANPVNPVNPGNPCLLFRICRRSSAPVKIGTDVFPDVAFPKLRQQVICRTYIFV